MSNGESPSYFRANKTFKKGAQGGEVRELQRDLRRLGYLGSGIDGVFGGGSEKAVKGLQHDLLTNDGSGRDGRAPVSVLDYNKSRVVLVDGILSPPLAECMVEMLDDDRFPKVAASDDPKEQNRQIAVQLEGMADTEVPRPFLLGVLKQESRLRHFEEPTPRNEDSFVVVGLDSNAGATHIISSRGYGVGQYTLFHHPPTSEEVDDFILNPAKNVTKAIRELRQKFDGFVNGATSGTRADDRIAEFGNGDLRLCKYDTGDARYMRDCQACMRQAGLHDIEVGATPFYEGSPHRYVPTQYHRASSYAGVPIRKNIECDWPYAVRRYNGSGVNSYHYQTKVLLNVLRGI